MLIWNVLLFSREWYLSGQLQRQKSVEKRTNISTLVENASNDVDISTVFFFASKKIEKALKNSKFQP